MTIAHVSGVPVDELLLPVLLTAGALTSGVGAWIAAHRRRTAPTNDRTRVRGPR